MLVGAILLINFSVSGCRSAKSLTVYIADSEKVIFVEPNEPVSIPYKGVLITRVKYWKLLNHENIARDHGLIE